jgi:hypothetical protein
VYDSQKRAVRVRTRSVPPEVRSQIQQQFEAAGYRVDYSDKGPGFLFLSIPSQPTKQEEEKASGHFIV